MEGETTELFRVTWAMEAIKRQLERAENNPENKRKNGQSSSQDCPSSVDEREGNLSIEPMSLQNYSSPPAPPEDDTSPPLDLQTIGKHMALVITKLDKVDGQSKRRFPKGNGGDGTKTERED